jgi:hypothetical protein
MGYRKEAAMGESCEEREAKTGRSVDPLRASRMASDPER